jgi:hypothetical protein
MKCVVMYTIHNKLCTNCDSSFKMKEQPVNAQCVPHIREIMQRGLKSFGCKPFTSLSSLDPDVMTYLN